MLRRLRFAFLPLICLALGLGAWAQPVTVSPASLAFAPQVLGSTSTGQIVTLTNNQAVPLNISAISPAGDFSQSNTCTTPVGAGVSCTITVSYSPTVLGAEGGSVTITDDAGNSPQSITLSGTGALAVTMAPATVSFGNQVLNVASAAQVVTLTNNQSIPLNISAIGASGDFAETDTCAASTPIGPGASCNISIKFTPTALGSRTGQVTVTDDANNSPQTVALSGVGVVAVALAPGALIFNNQVLGTTSLGQVVTLTNNQAVTLNISGIAAGGDFGQQTTCGATVAAGANCTITVAFSPSALGPRTGQLTVTDDAVTSPQTVPLSGTGVVAVAVTPATLTYGNQVLNVASATQTVTVTNNQAVAINFASIAASGDFSQTNTCGASIAAGASCSVTVTFTPTATGARSGTLTMTDDAATSPQTVSLSGTGVVAVAVTPPTLTYGNQVLNVASPTQTVTVSNNQAVALNFTSIAASGDFSHTNACGASIAAGANCTVSVTFNPTAFGSRSGTLSITDDASTSPQTVALTGTGVISVAVQPASLSYGNQVLNMPSAVQTVSITNNQSVTLNFTGIAATGDFSQTNTCGASIPAGATCTVSVTFAPTVSGARSGTLTVGDDAASSPQSVSLAGNGIAALTFSPASLTFPSQSVSVISKVAMFVTLTNPQATPVNITGIAATGDYSLTNTCGSALAGNKTCKITVWFTPTNVGTRTGAISVTGDSPFSVQLTGVGNASIGVTPNPISFGNVVLGTNIGQVQVTINNKLGVPLPVGNFHATGDFNAIDSCFGTLPASKMCNFQVAFFPSTPGAQSGSISFTYGPANTPVTVPLSGTGVAMALQFLTITPGRPTSAFGATQQFSATGLSNDGSRRNFTSQVTWTSSNPAVAAFNTGTPGLATIAGVGTATITANLGSVTQTTLLTAVNNVTITPRVASATYQQTLLFEADNPNGATTGFVWSVDGVPGGNATVGTIAGNGLYTPPQAVGSHIVTATSAANSALAANATVYVTNFQGVLTSHNDNLRTGQNVNETILTPANVGSPGFGRLFSYAVDGNIYGQPLYIQNLTVNGANHNVAYVATEHNSVYAFDADGLQGGSLWQVNFNNPAAGVIPVPMSDVNDPAIIPENGITSTMVIDPVSSTIYVVVATRENSTYVSRLHALDLATGSEKFNGPVAIQGSAPGTGFGSVAGVVPFTVRIHRQRPGLLLNQGVVYVGYSSYDDHGLAHGWLFGYDAQSLQQVSTFITSPNGKFGGIWGAGSSPSADANGKVYFPTGDGDYFQMTDFGDSVVQLTPGTGLLTASDFFTPFNNVVLSSRNLDLGSGGAILLPDQTGPFPHLLLAAGKQGTMYLLNRDNLGGVQVGSDTAPVQVIVGGTGPMYGSPAYWNGKVYIQGASSVLRVYQLVNGKLVLQTVTGPTAGWPGTTPSISSNGASNGIVWRVTSTTNTNSPATMTALDANNVAKVLYNSSTGTLNGRDNPGNTIKFCVPTVANGKVYLGTQSELAVYGLLP